MILRKWNYLTIRHEPYEVPDSGTYKIYSADADEIINCASCGRELAYSDSLPSLDIENGNGQGYSICKECHAKESARYKKFKNNLSAAEGV